VTQLRAKSLISLIEWNYAPKQRESAKARRINQLGHRLAVCPQSCPQQAIKSGNFFSISNLAAIVEMLLCKWTQPFLPHRW